MQIVNGCQTATTLALAHKDGKLAPDARVLVRIYETKNTDLVQKIVLTTNNQNKISSRDLRSNDPIQVDMERSFSKYGFYYERKPRQYDSLPNIDFNKIIPNELVAQIYLAQIMKKPSDARRRKYKVWGELYENIFNGQVIEPYVLSIFIHQRVAAWLDAAPEKTSTDIVKRKIANNGLFHIARILAFRLKKNDNWNDLTIIADLINNLSGKQSSIAPLIEQSFNIINDIFRTSPSGFINDIDNSLKSNLLDIEIDKYLHTKKFADKN